MTQNQKKQDEDETKGNAKNQTTWTKKTEKKQWKIRLVDWMKGETESEFEQEHEHERWIVSEIYGK